MECVKSVAYFWIILFVSTIGLISPVQGFLNVFIDQHEMVKLMGLDAELFYVRHGIVNQFALSFVVPVPEQVDDLTFSWQSLVDIPIRYSISIEYESQLGGLLTPHINVPVRGHVPLELSTFTIRLPCTGNVSEEVPVGINLEIDGYPHFNHTKLTFKRNKICMKDETIVETASESVVFKLIVFALAFLLVSSVILVTCYCRGSRSHNREKCLDPSPQTSYTIDESSSSSGTSSLVSSRTTTTTSNKPSLHYGRRLHHQQQQLNCGEYDDVEYGNTNKDRGFRRPPSITSCSSIYETIVESVNKFPMQTMHSNKTCGACCSLFGDTTLYDGVTIAGLVRPTPSSTCGNNSTKSKDFQQDTTRSTATRGATAIYDQPTDMSSIIRWPAPPLFTLEKEHQRGQGVGRSQRQSSQPSTMNSVKQQNPHCYSNNNVSGGSNQQHDTRSNMTPGFVVDGNPFSGIGGGLWNADAVAERRIGGQGGDGKESCTYYEVTPTFVNQHL